MASIDVEDVLSKLTEREKISLLAGGYFMSLAVMPTLRVSNRRSQASISGIHNQSPNMAFPLCDSLMVPMVSAAHASSTAPQQPASLAAQLSAQLSTLSSWKKPVV